VNNRETGNLAEKKAAEFLQSLGYTILCKNYCIRGGEIDIIFLDKDTVCFCEVKFRKDDRFGTPAEAVTKSKQKRLSAAAVKYLYENDMLEKNCRFDVIEIAGVGIITINHIKNAFEFIEA